MDACSAISVEVYVQSFHFVALTMMLQLVYSVRSSIVYIKYSAFTNTLSTPI